MNVVSRIDAIVSKSNTYDCDNFDRTEPELELSEELDTKVIDGDDGD